MTTTSVVIVYVPSSIISSMLSTFLMSTAVVNSSINNWDTVLMRYGIEHETEINQCMVY